MFDERPDGEMSDPAPEPLVESVRREQSAKMYPASLAEADLQALDEDARVPVLALSTSLV